MSYTLSNPGGGYTTAPTISTSNCPGLSGSNLTANINIVTSIQNNAALIMAVAGGNRILMGGWGGYSDKVTMQALGLQANAALKATYGALFFDPMPYFVKLHANHEGSLVRARKNFLPPEAAYSDGLHPTDASMGYYGREIARMERVLMSIGPAYIHDDVFSVQATAQAFGSTVGTLRVLGTAIGMRIVESTQEDVVRLSTSAPWTLTRGTTVPNSIVEVMVEGESVGKGPTNRSRITLMRTADDTSTSHIARVVGNGASGLRTPGLTGVTNGTQLTIAFMGRISNTSTGNTSMLMDESGSTYTAHDWLSKAGRYFQLAPRDINGNAIVNMAGPVSTNPYGFNLFWGCIDTVAGTASFGVNEQTPVTATPTLNAQFAFTALRAIYQNQWGNDSATLFSGWDEQFFWLAPGFIDLTQSSNRALFYNAATATPVNITSTVAGITATIFMRGLAADRMRGNNFGSGGQFYPSAYVNMESAGWLDLTS